jgi:colicin import membrane protein
MTAARPSWHACKGWPAAPAGGSGQRTAAGGSRTGGAGSSASGGPSAGYGAKVAARVKPNIVYPDAVSGNPRAEVRVRTAPDGTITSATISKSSGNAAWDEAVVRALHKTDKLPRDIDGKVPSDLVIGFRPQD